MAIRSSSTADTQALVDTFFDALGHFAGEPPALDELVRVLAPRAKILAPSDDAKGSGSRSARGTESCYVRDAWLRRVVASADRHRRAGHGHFFEELERTVVERASQLCVRSVVEERLTEAGRVASRTTLRCWLVVSQVGPRAAITRVRVRRTTARASDQIA
jgi:hypothetical protein